MIIWWHHGDTRSLPLRCDGKTYTRGSMPTKGIKSFWRSANYPPPSVQCKRKTWRAVLQGVSVTVSQGWGTPYQRDTAGEDDCQWRRKGAEEHLTELRNALRNTQRWEHIFKSSVKWHHGHLISKRGRVLKSNENKRIFQLKSIPRLMLLWKKLTYRRQRLSKKKYLLKRMKMQYRIN